MVHAIHALIRYRGNVVRSRIARPATVLRYLARRRDLDSYNVVYWHYGTPQQVTAAEFQTRFVAQEDGPHA